MEYKTSKKLNAYLQGKSEKINRIAKIYLNSNDLKMQSPNKINDSSHFRKSEHSFNTQGSNSSTVTDFSKLAQMPLPKVLDLYNRQISHLKIFKKMNLNNNSNNSNSIKNNPSYESNSFNSNQNNYNSFNSYSSYSIESSKLEEKKDNVRDIAVKEKYDFCENLNFDDILNNLQLDGFNKSLGLKKNNKNDYETRTLKYKKVYSSKGIVIKNEEQDEDNINNEEVYYDKFDDLNNVNFEELIDIEDNNLNNEEFNNLNKQYTNRKSDLKEVTEVHEQDSNEISISKFLQNEEANENNAPDDINIKQHSENEKIEKVKKIQSFFRNKNSQLIMNKQKIFTGFDQDRNNVIQIYIDKISTERELIKFIYAKIYSVKEMSSRTEKFTITEFFEFKAAVSFNEIIKNMKAIIEKLNQLLVFKSTRRKKKHSEAEVEESFPSYIDNKQEIKNEEFIINENTESYKEHNLDESRKSLSSIDNFEYEC